MTSKRNYWDVAYSNPPKPFIIPVNYCEILCALNKSPRNINYNNLKSLKVSKLWIFIKLFIMTYNLRIIWLNGWMVQMTWHELLLFWPILVWLVRIQKVELQFSQVQNVLMLRQVLRIFSPLVVFICLCFWKKIHFWKFYLCQ